MSEVVEKVFEEYIALGAKVIDITQLKRDLRTVSQKQLVEVLSNIKDEIFHGSSVLHIAAVEGHTELLSCIFEHIQQPEDRLKLLKLRRRDYTIIHLAAIHRRPESMKYLTEVMRSIPEEDKIALLSEPVMHNLSVLHFAASTCRLDIMHSVLSQISTEKVIDMLNEGASRKGTVLHYAAEKGQADIIKCMLGFVSDDHIDNVLTQETGESKTAMHLAAENNKLQVIEFLLNNMAAEFVTELLKKQDKYGYTPVMYAAQYGYIECIQCILGHRSPSQKLSLLQLKSDDGKTAKDLAAEQSYTNIVSFLQKLTTKSEQKVAAEWRTKKEQLVKERQEALQELRLVKQKLAECEERLRELDSETQAFEQLIKKREEYKRLIDKLERKEKVILKKLNEMKNQPATPVTDLTCTEDAVPEVATDAVQIAELKEIELSSGDEEISDAESTNLSADSQVFYQDIQTNGTEINTSFSRETEGKLNGQCWRCKTCGSLDIEIDEQSLAE